MDSRKLQRGHDHRLSAMADRSLPLAADFVPSQREILNNLGEGAKAAGGYLVGWASAFTAGTAGFLLQFCVMLYAMFFFPARR